MMKTNTRVPRKEAQLTRLQGKEDIGGEKRSTVAVYSVPYCDFALPPVRIQGIRFYLGVKRGRAMMIANE